MKINITGIRGIPAQHGGFETFAESLSLYLHDKSWDVTVYCQTTGWGFCFNDKWNGIDRVNIPIPFSGPLSTILFDLLSVLHVCFFSRSLTLVLGYNTAILSVFYRVFHITSIMNMDGIEWQRSKWGPAVKIWFRLNEWLGCKLSNHLVADHDEIKKHLISRHGVLPISTIPYGAPAITEASSSHLTKYNLKKNEYYIVIARPEPENSIVEIVSGFVASGSNKKLVILGNYSPSINYQSRVLNAADNRVCFLGAIYDRAIVDALRYYCFAYIHGHTVGGTNPSLVEAMGAGCSIIVRENRFNRGVCDDSALYFHDSQDLTSLINNIADDSVKALKSQSSARFENGYTLESVNRNYMNLFSSISNPST